MTTYARLSAAEAILFDYGNTLIEFGPRQMDQLRLKLEQCLAEYGPVDAAALRSIRDRQLSAPYLNGHKENELNEITRELLRELFAHEPTPDETQRLVARRCASFLECVDSADGVHALLSRLGTRFRLALVSNYPCGQCVRDSLKQVGYAELFETVVVSGDVGWCKPHPKPFEQALAELGLSAERCVYVGDNWLCDVQGAKGIGMSAVLTTEYTPYQLITPQPNDHEPDARITRLSELETLLG